MRRSLDSLVDMSGPGADRSPWGATTNVVLRCVPVLGASVAEADRAVRESPLLVGIALAGCTAGASRARCSRGRFASPADAALPAIVVVLQVASEGPLLDTFLDGLPLGARVSRVLDERVLHEGG